MSALTDLQDALDKLARMAVYDEDSHTVYSLQPPDTAMGLQAEVVREALLHVGSVSIESVLQDRYDAAKAASDHDAIRGYPIIARHFHNVELS